MGLSGLSLRDLLTALSTLPPDGVVYAVKPWSMTSAARCTDGADQSRTGLLDDGLHYLLEVELIRDVAEVWSAWRGGRSPTVEDLGAAVIYYATFDAYQPVGNS